MSAAKYTRIADDVSVDASQVDLGPAPAQVKPKKRRRLVLTLVSIFALLLVIFGVTTPRSDPEPYNPLPSRNDRSSSRRYVARYGRLLLRNLVYRRFTEADTGRSAR